jgi:hypothetical protein
VSLPTEAPARIRDLVQAHKVCWETYPHKLPSPAGSRTVGFEVLLIGTAEGSEPEISPGDERSHQVYYDLRQIAEFVIAEDEQVRCEIEPFDPFVALSPRRKFRKDIVLTIEIGDREQFDNVVLDAEVRSLRRIEQTLRDLGARPGSW